MVLNKADPVALRHIESYKGDKFRHYYQDRIRDEASVALTLVVMHGIAATAEGAAAVEPVRRIRQSFASAANSNEELRCASS